MANRKSHRKQSEGRPSRTAPQDGLRQATKAITVAGWIVFAVTAVFTYRRIYFGIDFTDEASYVAMPYSYFLGNKPFVHEILVQQTGTFFFYPLIALYLKLTGSSQGIVLFVRHLFFTLTLANALTVYFFFRKIAPRWAVPLVAAGALTFIPFVIPSISYNTMSSFLFSIGCFLGVASFLGASPIAGLISGFLMIWAGFSHASMIFPALLFGGILSVFQLKRFGGEGITKQYKFWLAGFIGMSIFCAGLLLSFGWDNLLFSFAKTKEGGAGGGAYKLVSVFQAGLSNFPYLGIFLGIAAVFFGLSRLTKVSFAWAALSLPVLYFYRYYGFDGFSLTDNLLVYQCLMGGGLFAGFFLSSGKPAPNRNLERAIFCLIWIPSVFAAIFAGWASSNGFANCALGAFPGAIVTLYYLSKKKYVGPLYLLIFLATTLIYQYQYVYRDDPLPNLTFKINQGPFKGIFTSEERMRMIDEVQSDFDRFAPGRRTLASFDLFPAAYLFTNLRPSCQQVTPIALTFLYTDRQYMVDFYKNPENLPDLVFDFKSIPYRTGQSLPIFKVGEMQDPVRSFFSTHPDYEEVAVRGHYRILARKSAH